MPTPQQRNLIVWGGQVIPWYQAGDAPLPVAAYQPKGSASLAASYTNLANNGAAYNAAPGTAPTFAAATGWTFAAASSQYLTTGITPTQNTTCLVRFASATAGAAFGMRSVSNTYRYEIWPFVAGSPSKRQYGNGASLAIDNGQSSGVMAVAGLDPYLNGADDGTLVASVAAGVAMYIGAVNANGTTSFYFGGSIQAWAYYDSILTPSQVAAVSAAMAAL